MTRLFHTNDMAAVESAIRSMPWVADCAIVTVSLQSGPFPLAYVVPGGAFSEAQIRSRLESVLPPQTPMPGAIVPVDTLPFTASGEIDRAALTALPVLDDALVQDWEARLRDLPALRQAAFLMQPRTRAPRRLLRADLPAPPAAAPPRTKPATMGPADPADSRPAVSEGGPLQQPADAPTTLPELLLRAARQVPLRGFIHHLPGGEQVERSYAAVLEEARCVLAGLRANGIGPGSHVILQISRGPGFIAALWGCFLGGIVPAPVTVAPSYSAPNSTLAKLRSAWLLLDKPPVITEAALAGGVQKLEQVNDMPGLDVLTVEALVAHNPAEALHPATPDDIALLLFTSGSTGNAKAVGQRHRNLLAMSAGTIAMNGFTAADVTLNWMPLDHVGSLAFLSVVPMDLGCTQIHAANNWILEDPVRWLSLIEKHRATIAWAPNFAFALLEKRRDAISETVGDLSSMRFMVNAGEANIAATMRRFIGLLAGHGLTDNVLRPAFGMSETCSGITWSAGFSMDTADGAPVELGRPIPGASLRIVDETGVVLREGQIGRFQVRGPSVFQGYCRNPQANREAFEDGWFTTGDLGMLRDGKLIVTGRQREDLVVNGVHHACHDVEALIEELDGVTTSFTAAVPVRHPGNGVEEIAIFFHTALAEPRARAALERRIRGAVAAQTGASPKYLVAVERDEVPKTAIGKIQRPQLRKRFEAGDFADRLGEAEAAGLLPDWFLRPVWRPRVIEAPADPGQRPLLLVEGAAHAGAALSNAIRDRWTGPVRIIRAGAEPEQQLEALFRDGFVPAEILYLAMFDPGAPAPIGSGSPAGAWFEGHVEALAELIAIAGSLARVPGAGAVLRVVTCGPAGLRGFLNTLGRENPGLRCQHIDLSPGGETASFAEQVVAELQVTTPEEAVRWRGNQRMVARLERIRWEERHVMPAEPIRRGGHYLVAGGLGGIGRVLCRHLLEQYGVRLLVIGNTRLPGAETPAGSAEHTEKANDRAAALQALERCGGSGSIRYLPIDVCDHDGLAACLTRAEAESGSLDGVINLAGAGSEQPLASETLASLRAALRAKILGTVTLDRLIGRRPGTLFLHFSSVSGCFGGVGAGAYAAACGFVDDFAEQRRRHGTGEEAIRSVCFAWSRWQDTGMSAARASGDGAAAAQGFRSLSAEQGLVSLEAALRRGEDTLLIGVDDTSPRVRGLLDRAPEVLREAFVFVDAPGENLPDSRITALKLCDRLGRPAEFRIVRVAGLPLLESGAIDRQRLAEGRGDTTETVAPRTPTEAAIAEIWSELLGTSAFGVFDNFFEMGGQSLLATSLVSRMRDRLGVELGIDAVFTKPTIAALATACGGAEGSAGIPPLRRAARDRSLPLSFAQERLWILERMAGGATPYNEMIAMILHGDVQPDALSRSLAGLVRRHEILRTRFPLRGAAAVQEVADDAGVTLRLIDLSATNAADRRRALDEAITAIRAEPFDLARGPLLRVAVLRLEPRSAVLAVVLHHIVVDAWSLGLLMRDWSALYRGAELPAPALHYADFAAWQRGWLAGPALERELGYWRDVLRGAPALLELPVDRPRPPLPRHRGGRVPVVLESGLVERLRDIGGRDGATLFMTLTAVFATLLHRLSGQEDFLLGLPVANRRHSETEAIPGVFVNTLVLRIDLSGSPAFDELLRRVRQSALGAYAHQDLPFERLVDDLQPDRNPGTNPLVQVMIELQDQPLALLDLPETDVEAADFGEPVVRVDLELHLYEHPDGVRGYFLYDADLFDAGRIERMAEQLTVLAAAAVRDPARRADALDLLPPAERRMVQETFAAPHAAAAVVPGACMHTLVEAQAAKLPDAEAVCEGGCSITYAELINRADRLAARLRRFGVGPEVVVAQYIPRSIAQVVGLLAILKAGGVYLPLEVTDPLERTARLLDDSGAPVVLTVQALEGSLPSFAGQVLCMDDGRDARAAADAGIAVHPDGAAYLIYTSGSTGLPKGALLAHRGFVAMIGSQIRAFAISPADRVLQFASTAFDASLSEIFMALGAGACLVVTPDAARADPAALRDFLRSEKISVATLPPPVLRQIGAAALGPLRLLVTAGEAAPVAEVSAAAANMTVWNGYGPTEASVCASMHCVEAAASYPSGVPIGQPLPGTELLILRGGEPAPIGEPGEICLGGPGLARGYPRQPGLTAHRFVPHPWRAGQRLYRTGDVGRWQPDGTVLFGGRVDHEVKVRGHRVAPGEVERVLLEHPRVGQVCVTGYREADGLTGLCGYYSTGGGLELWPSLAEFFVYDTLLYAAMAGHKERNERYRAAFGKVLAGRTVVEIGPGPEAILARLCIEAGAKRVYCIELLPETYQRARQAVEALGLSDRIVVLHGDVRTTELPEPVDYCVSEIVGSAGGAEGAALLINAARRFLSDGRNMIPARAETRLAAVSVSEGLELAFPDTAAHYVNEVFARKGYKFDLRLCLKHAARRHLLSTEEVLEDLDFTREVAPEASHAVELRFTRSGLFHGFLAWLVLHADAAEVLDTLDSQDSWLPLFLPVSLAGLEVSEGDVFRGRVERRLSSNGLNPDYIVRGVLQRRPGADLPIGVESRHDAPVFRGSEFYRALFAGDAVPVARPPEPNELRAYMAQRLPRFMVPGRMVRLPRLPLTSSGKVDRAALSASWAAPVAAVAAEPPRNAVEAAVASIWCDVLDLERVGVRDNFFDAGGHSLRMVQVHQRLETLFGGCVTPFELFQFPTIEAIAALINRRTQPEAAAEPVQASAPVHVRDTGGGEALRRQANVRRAHRAPAETVGEAG